jgi:hypothetical protein
LELAALSFGGGPEKERRRFSTQEAIRRLIEIAATAKPERRTKPGEK